MNLLFFYIKYWYWTLKKMILVLLFCLRELNLFFVFVLSSDRSSILPGPITTRPPAPFSEACFTWSSAPCSPESLAFATGSHSSPWWSFQSTPQPSSIASVSPCLIKYFLINPQFLVSAFWSYNPHLLSITSLTFSFGHLISVYIAWM